MSVDSLFRVGGDPYSGLSDAVALLPSRSLRVLATDVLRYLVSLDRKGDLTELVTDRCIADALGWSVRSVQRALHALHRVLEGQGCAIINRVRQHGRRLISFVRGLASSRGKPASLPIPPAPPSEDKTRTASTGDGPSSPSTSIPEGGDKTDHSGLIDRAIALPKDQRPTRANVQWAIDTYGAEWVDQVVTEGESRTAKDPVRNWSWAEIRLEAWLGKGGPPERPTPPPDPAVRAEEERARRAAESAQRQAIEREKLQSKGLWDSLSPEQRAEIEAQVDREQPGIRNRFESMFNAFCRARAWEQHGETRGPPSRE